MEAKITEVSLQRSAIMRAVRQRDTKPEMAVRRALHALGFRFRLQRKDLPGRPDIVLPKRKIAVFVHGCFWHRHGGCSKTTSPKTRQEFWDAKFETNVRRDLRVRAELEALGWEVITIWECEAKDGPKLKAELWDRLGTAKGNGSSSGFARLADEDL